MTYIYIDDDAWSHCRHAVPYSAWGQVRQRENLQQIHEQRRQAGGWSAPGGVSGGSFKGDSKPIDLAAPWPVSWPMGCVYIEPADSGSTVVLRLRGQATWTRGLNISGRIGDPSVHIALTAWQPGTVVTPPVADDYTTLDTAAEPDDYEISCSTRNLHGWAVVLLWLRSEAELEVGGPDLLRGHSPHGVISIEGTSGPLPKPEYTPCVAVGVMSTSDDGAKAEYQDGHGLRLVCAWEEDVESGSYHPGVGEVHRLAIVPPATYSEGDDFIHLGFGRDQLRYYSLGRLVLLSVSWRLEPPTQRIPGVRAYHSDTPCTDRSAAALAVESDRLARQRLPLVWGSVGTTRDTTLSVPATVLGVRRSNRIFDDNSIRIDDSSTPFTPIISDLASGIVHDVEPGARGWEVMVAFHARRRRMHTISGVPQRTSEPECRLTLRLVADELQGGAWVEVAQGPARIMTVYPDYGWHASSSRSTYQQAQWAIDQVPRGIGYMRWGLRGALVHPPSVGAETPQDRPCHAGLWSDSATLSADAIDPGWYPIRLRLTIQPQLPIRQDEADILLVACACRTLPGGR